MSSSVWPKGLLDGMTRNWDLGHLHGQKLEFRRDPESFTKLYHGGQDWLLGHVIPPFQRPLVWDEGQMVRFIESAVLGLHIGTWVYNSGLDAPTERVDGREYLHRTDRWVIDGQQRLTALDRFWDDRFPVFGYYWSQVPQIDQRRFLRIGFSAFETRILDEAVLRELYDRLNFGGVAHTQDQRATRGDEQVLPTSDEASGPAPGR